MPLNKRTLIRLFFLRILKMKNFKILRVNGQNSTNRVLKIFLTMLLFFNLQPVWAHVIVKELSKMSGPGIAGFYLQAGFRHILPFGFDHILFVLSIFLLSPGLKSILWQSSAFTAAHSVTLGLAMYGIITPSARIIEPLIAISILYVALENIISPRLKASRIGIVFLFGLVHGLGFAGSLGQLGLPPNNFLLSLLMFNLGVELGQATIILFAFVCVKKWIMKNSYRNYIVIPGSLIIASMALILVIQRLLIF
jgi:HupE/UreJ protein